MQQAIPYRNWLPSGAAGGSTATAAELVVTDAKSVKQVVAENAVVVFARKGCCMCHVLKLLLHGHGVNPSILTVDEQNEAEVIKELSNGNAAAAPDQFPAVFVGGEHFGGLEKIMGAHISGELLPRLREAKALWL